jgi:hypothetical protein
MRDSREIRNSVAEKQKKKNKRERGKKHERKTNEGKVKKKKVYTEEGWSGGQDGGRLSSCVNSIADGHHTCTAVSVTRFARQKRNSACHSDSPLSHIGI